MCELLVCGYDQTSSNFYYNCALPKTGDVIWIAEDNHAWGQVEAQNSQWRIICLPGVDPSDLSNLLTPEINTIAPPAAPSQTLQYRGYFLDESLVTIDPVLSAYLQDNTRAASKYIMQDGVGSLQSAISQRPPIADPALVGNSATTVG